VLIDLAIFKPAYSAETSMIEDCTIPISEGWTKEVSYATCKGMKEISLYLKRFVCIK
jgi:hypothetical protein